MGLQPLADAPPLNPTSTRGWITHPGGSRLSRSARFLFLVAVRFVKNRCLVRASGLSYTTLLALVPLLAIAISVTTSLIKQQGEDRIVIFINELVSKVAPQLDLVSKSDDGATASATKDVATRISHFVGNVRSGALGMTSVVALVFVAISLLRTIESAFNEIWGETEGRPFLTSLVQYWGAITLGPLLLIVVVGLSTGPHLEFTRNLLARLPMDAQVFALFLLQFVPFALTIVGFAVFYALIPNTKVHWLAALVGGAVGGTLWQLNSLFSIIYVSKVMTYKTLYGSLGILPVFLLGVYVSWVILLFGAQVAFAFQHRHTFARDHHNVAFNGHDRALAAVHVCELITRRFLAAQPAPTQSDLISELKLPPSLVEELVGGLACNGLLTELKGQPPRYGLARDARTIHLTDILHAVHAGQTPALPPEELPRGALFSPRIAALHTWTASSADNLSLDALARGAGAVSV